jgi:hypothetical protein
VHIFIPLLIIYIRCGVMARGKGNTGGNTAGNSAGGGMGIIGKILILLVALGIIGAGALFLLGPSLLGSTPPAPALQTFSQSGTVPASYSTVFQNPGSSMDNLTSLIKTNLDSDQQFHVNYTGTVYFASSNRALSLLGTVSSPTYLWLAQYNGSKHLSFTASAVSVLGSLNVQWLSYPYVCANFNVAQASQGDITALLGSKQSSCTQGSVLGGVDLSQMYNFDFNQLSHFGINLVYNNSYQSSYRGTPCTVIAGTVSGSAGNGRFIMCMSDTYYVPLSIGINDTGPSGSFAIFLNETSIGNSANQSVVTTPPYPTT